MRALIAMLLLGLAGREVSSEPRVTWVSELVAPAPLRLESPIDVAVAPDGTVWVGLQSDSVHAFAPDGRHLRHFGERYACCDRTLPTSRFFSISGIAVDADGFVYVVDLGSFVNGYPSRLRRFTPEGRFQSELTIAGREERFEYPRDVAVDARGLVFVSDWGRKRIVVLSRTQGVIGTFAIDFPWGLIVDEARGELVVNRFDGGTGLNDLVRVGLDGRLVARWGEGAQPGFRAAVDAAGRIYTTSGHGVKVFSPDGQMLLAWGTYGSEPGMFKESTGIAIDGQGRVLVGDHGNARVQVFEVSWE